MVNIRRYGPWSALVFACLGLAWWLVVGWGSKSTPDSVEPVGLGVLAMYASVCSVLAARSAHGRSRTTWTTMALALATLTVAELIWAFYSVVLCRLSFPSPADAFYVAFCVLAVAAIVWFPPGLTAHSRVRLLLDCLVVAAALLLLVWAILPETMYQAHHEDKAGPALAILYLMLDFFVALVAVLVLTRGAVGQRGVLRLLAAAFVLRGFSDIGWYAYQATAGPYHTGIDIGWALSLVIVSVAALMTRGPQSIDPPTPIDPVPPRTSLWLPHLPLLIAGTIGPALVLTGPLQVEIPVLMTLVCVRQSYAAWENRRLLRATADQASRDPLTGLANRTLFHNRLAHSMALRQHDRSLVAVVVVDLDDFKLVNDTLGHPVADSVLVSVGQRLAGCVRPTDTVARLGGDEFAVLLQGPVGHLRPVGERVVGAFDEPFVIDGEQIVLRPSVGMALASAAEPDLTPEELVQRADIAMYAAKRARSSGVHTFSPETTRTDPELLKLANNTARRPAHNGAAQIRLLGQLRHAIDHGELDVVYQPEIELSTSRIVRVEALLRWPHPQLGELRPEAFLSLVRQHGLMQPVTDLVLNKALDDAARWALLGAPTPVAVNLFAALLRDTRLPDTLCRALDARDLPPDVLTVEITEDAVLPDLKQVTTMLQQLHEHSIRVAIDDFGTGYSALSYLPDIPIDDIKLDRQLIAPVTSHERAAMVVRAIIDLAHQLGITVVAEGIENAATVAWLCEHGCDIGQGYHLGIPLTAANITQLLTATHTEHSDPSGHSTTRSSHPHSHPPDPITTRQEPITPRIS